MQSYFEPGSEGRHKKISGYFIGRTTKGVGSLRERPPKKCFFVGLVEPLRGVGVNPLNHKANFFCFKGNIGQNNMNH